LLKLKQIVPIVQGLGQPSRLTLYYYFYQSIDDFVLLAAPEAVSRTDLANRFAIIDAFSIWITPFRELHVRDIDCIFYCSPNDIGNLFHPV
jgi:hypothetical protein